MGGPVPEFFGGLQELSITMLRFNMFSGGIGMFGNCSRLQKIYFSYNKLNGSFPPFKGQQWNFIENYERTKQSNLGRNSPCAHYHKLQWSQERGIRSNNKLTGAISL